MGIPSPLELSIILLIAIVLFGSKRIRGLGEDLGAAIRGLRSGAKEITEAQEDLKDV